MSKCPHLPRLPGLLALALAAVAIFAATSSAHGKRTTERLVVRGTDTVVDAPCPGGLCITLADGSFGGTPIADGAYSGALKLELAEVFPNGEGGVCAPIAGTIELGQGTPDRLVLAVEGDSCQDGAGNPANSSFTGLARWVVKGGAGAYAKARGHGVASFAEAADDSQQTTLMGEITP